jgi:tryptophan-rich sensory protein
MLMGRLHYILVPLFYLGVSAAGSAFTARGLDYWYPALNKPSYTPPGSLIGVIWTVIYILTALSLILLINADPEKPLLSRLVGLFVLNGLLNAAWSYIFFTRHMIGWAVIGASLIGLTVLLMMAAAWPVSRISSLLLLPYLGWVTFATYLNFDIFRMN